MNTLLEGIYHINSDNRSSKRRRRMSWWVGEKRNEARWYSLNASLLHIAHYTLHFT